MKPFWILALLIAVSTVLQARKYPFLVGTYTNTGKSQGIYAYEFDGKTLEFLQKSVTSGVSNPSYLCLSPDKKFVYSVNESPEGSAANAFAFDAAQGKLRLLNRSLTNGKGPCCISCTERHVFTANYGGGSLSVFNRQADGSLGSCVQKIQHHGSSIRVDRQAEPHVHQVVVSNGFVFANDLGTDMVTVYAYQPSSQQDILTPWDSLAVRKGSGPRHLAFSRDGKRAYVLQELDGTVSVLSVEKGRLALLQEATVVGNANQKAWAADIHLSPDGNFLYATNRAPANSITCFAIRQDGRLESRFTVSTLGDGPRNFALTPDGRFLLVAHQFSNDIVLFRRNIQTGTLTDTGKRVEVGSPVCLLFY